jgi:hypothetical protein
LSSIARNSHSQYSTRNPGRGSVSAAQKRRPALSARLSGSHWLTPRGQALIGPFKHVMARVFGLATGSTSGGKKGGSESGFGCIRLHSAVFACSWLYFAAFGYHRVESAAVGGCRGRDGLLRFIHVSLRQSCGIQQARLTDGFITVVLTKRGQIIMIIISFKLKIMSKNLNSRGNITSQLMRSSQSHVINSCV